MNTNRNANRLCKSFVVAATIALWSGLAFSQMAPHTNSPGVDSTNAPGSQRLAQEQMNDQQTSTQQIADKMFVRRALEGGMAEVQLGQMAVQKGSSDDVKNFGQKMVDDHTRMGREMQAVAHQMNVAIPTKTDSKDQLLYAKLQSLSGTDFDTAYVKAMVKDHKKDDSEFREEAQVAADPKLKQVVTMGEQVIAQHLQMIETIAKTNNIASK